MAYCILKLFEMSQLNFGEETTPQVSRVLESRILRTKYARKNIILPNWTNVCQNCTMWSTAEATSQHDMRLK